MILIHLEIYGYEFISSYLMKPDTGNTISAVSYHLYIGIANFARKYLESLIN